jgi:hypothetical protein
MFVQISNGTGAQCEWCLLEFQGEVLGDLAGNELGQLELKEVGETLFAGSYAVLLSVLGVCQIQHIIVSSLLSTGWQSRDGYRAAFFGRICCNPEGAISGCGNAQAGRRRAGPGDDNRRIRKDENNIQDET